MENDQSIADLLTMIARHYQAQIADPHTPKSKTRLEVIRKLELTIQSIKGLMKSEQKTL